MAVSSLAELLGLYCKII